jgi:hypothetical protein
MGWRGAVDHTRQPLRSPQNSCRSTDDVPLIAQSYGHHYGDWRRCAPPPEGSGVESWRRKWVARDYRRRLRAALSRLRRSALFGALRFRRRSKRLRSLGP